MHLLCPLCRDRLHGSLVLAECPVCRTSYHQACRTELSQCAVLGCAGRPVIPTLMVLAARELPACRVCDEPVGPDAPGDVCPSCDLPVARVRQGPPLPSLPLPPRRGWRGWPALPPAPRLPTPGPDVVGVCLSMLLNAALILSALALTGALS